MSVHVVIHKGFKNVSFENSLVGILLAIFKHKFCEFDVLFIDSQWKICHDFKVFSIYHIELSVLLGYLQQHKHQIQNKIIIDVKWDFVYNYKDNFDNAIVQLHELLKDMKDVPFLWLQASNPKLLCLFHKYGFQQNWKMGLIVYNTLEFDKWKEYIDYAMISMSDFTLEEIIQIHKEKLLFGYTCTDLTRLTFYKHLFPYLEGIICDVCAF